MRRESRAHLNCTNYIILPAYFGSRVCQTIKHVFVIASSSQLFDRSPLPGDQNFLTKTSVDIPTQSHQTASWNVHDQLAFVLVWICIFHKEFD